MQTGYNSIYHNRCPVKLALTVILAMAGLRLVTLQAYMDEYLPEAIPHQGGSPSIHSRGHLTTFYVYCQANPSPTYCFQYWEWPSGASASNNPYVSLTWPYFTYLPKKAYFRRVDTPDSIQIDPAGAGTVSVAFVSFNVITYTAHPSPHYRFNRWMVRSQAHPDAPVQYSSVNPYTFAQQSSYPYYPAQAHFTAIPQYSISGPTPAHGSVSGYGTYYEGDPVTLTATPDAHYHFAYWSGDAFGSNPQLQFTAIRNKYIVANFAINRYTVTVPAPSHGNVTGADEYDALVTVTLTAIPDDYYHFMNWSGDLSSSNNPFVFSVTNDVTVNALFTNYAYTVTVLTPTNGSVTGAGLYDAGALATLTAYPTQDCYFAGWSGDLTATNNPLAFTVTGDVTLAASFVHQPTIEIVYPSEDAQFLEGDAVRIAAVTNGVGLSLTRVEFFADQSKIGEDEEEPYEILWENVPAGNYALTANATYAYGSQTNSSPVHISVNPVPPPSPGEFDPGGLITITIEGL